MQDLGCKAVQPISWNKDPESSPGCTGQRSQERLRIFPPSQSQQLGHSCQAVLSVEGRTAFGDSHIHHPQQNLMDSQSFWAAFYCREGWGFMWTGFVKAVVQIFVLCSLAAKGWVQTTSPFKVPLTCYKRIDPILVVLWASSLVCRLYKARLTYIAWNRGKGMTEQCCKDGNPPAQGWKPSCTGKSSGLGSGCKKGTSGISSHCTIPSVSQVISSIPLAPGKAGPSHGWLLREAVPSCRHCIRWFVLTAGKENSKDNRIHRKILACGFSAQVRLELLYKWLRIRSDYQGYRV